MMDTDSIVEIASDVLRIQIDKQGAQLHSIYNIHDEVEYLWQRDSVLWSSSAPVVFPVIGKLNHLAYRLDGKLYNMKSNGILRYETLSVVEKGDSYVDFLFVNTERTMVNYPYACRVKVRYELQGATLHVTATIYNDDTKKMYYNYAGHPGFRIPLYCHESCDDYYIEFEKREALNIYEVCKSGQLLNSMTQFFDDEKRFFVRKNLFQKEALVFQHPQSTWVCIKCLHHDRQIKVSFEGFDNLAIWSPYKKEERLRFLCIEPWIGHTDVKGYTGDFSKRDEIAELDAQEQKSYTYHIACI